jgi:hypothetical protein
MSANTPPPKMNRPRSAGWRENRWFLIGLLLVVALNFTIRLRLAATPLERDEGEYA